MTLRYVSGFCHHQISTEKVQEILRVGCLLFAYLANSVEFEIEIEWGGLDLNHIWIKFGFEVSIHCTILWQCDGNCGFLQIFQLMTA